MGKPHQARSKPGPKLLLLGLALLLLSSSILSVSSSSHKSDEALKKGEDTKVPANKHKGTKKPDKPDDIAPASTRKSSTNGSPKRKAANSPQPSNPTPKPQAAPSKEKTGAIPPKPQKTGAVPPQPKTGALPPAPKPRVAPPKPKTGTPNHTAPISKSLRQKAKSLPSVEDVAKTCLPSISLCGHSQRIAQRLAISVAKFMAVEEQPIEVALSIGKTWLSHQKKQGYTLDHECF